MTAEPPRTSLVVFGATGFTGKRVALEIAASIQLFHREQQRQQPFTWAIAGRRKASLERIRDEIRSQVGAAAGKDAANVEHGLLPALVEANVDDANSLHAMAASTRMVLNCVGPYAHYGEAVVRAVVEASESAAQRSGGSQQATHYIDLCGEPNFIERMVLVYRARARQAGCVILSAAAYDSVPAELGVIFAKQQLGKGVTPASVEMISEVKTESSLAFHYGTYASAINGFSPEGRKMLSTNRKKLYAELPKAVPTFASKGLTGGVPKREKRLGGLLTYDEKLDTVLVPHFAADPAVVRLGQSLTLQSDPKFEPVQFVGWIALPSAWIAVLMAFVMSIFGLLVKFDRGRRLLLAHPKLFTMGLFSHDGPSAKQLQDTSFVTTFIARGYSEAAFASRKSNRPDVTTVVKVRGPEPGYVATPILFVMVARVVLAEEDRIEPGVSVPGAALRDTSLIKMLNEDGRVTLKPVVSP